MNFDRTRHSTGPSASESADESPKEGVVPQISHLLGAVLEKNGPLAEAADGGFQEVPDSRIVGVAQSSTFGLDPPALRERG